MIVRGVWPQSVEPYFRMIINPAGNKQVPLELASSRLMNFSEPEIHEVLTKSLDTTNNSVSTYDNNSSLSQSRIYAPMLDSILGETHAHSDIGIGIKLICLMVQFIHSNAIFFIVISLANHYANILNEINQNLEKYESRRLLKLLIILRDSSEQISIFLSFPFSLVIQLVFTRQIALIGVFIQSTMQTYENGAILLQTFTSGLSLFIVFLYCDGLQSASKQTHRLKTEQTVIDDSRGGDQSIYEFLDYLNLLSKSIRITFFNIIAINKSSLVSLYGHILTLTFVTS